MTTCFAAITLLIVAWMATLTALYAAWRRSRDRMMREPASSDLFLTIASEKTREARESLMALNHLDALAGIKVFRLMGGELLPLAQGKEQTVEPELKSAVERAVAEAGPGRGATISCQGSTFLVKRAGKGDPCLVIVEDVTESFETARRMKENERLAMLGKMGANMAHQLKTPLAVLAGRAQMLQRRLGGNSEAYHLCTEIFEEARELAERIAQVVELYRIQEPDIRNASLAHIMDEARKRLAKSEGDTRIEVTCPPELEIKTDARIVCNIIFLVAQNSLKPDVAATKVAIKAHEKEKGVEISIEDDGVGIPESQVATLFEPFKVTSEDGLGLGLFLAKDLAARIGGDIRLEQAAKGAKFTITIPGDRGRGPA